MSPQRVSATGQKKGIFGLDRAKAGQRQNNTGRAARTFRRRVLLDEMRWVSAEPIGVMSLPGRNSLSRFPDAGYEDSSGADHEFVIGASGCNKLKD
jgi:hypothetical protein